MKTTAVASMFAHHGLIKSPMISLSLTSMNRNTSAGGHGENRDYVDDENYVDQREAGDEERWRQQRRRRE